MNKTTKKINTKDIEPILHINGVPSFQNLTKQDYYSFLVTLEFEAKSYYKDKNVVGNDKKKIPP